MSNSEFVTLAEGEKEHIIYGPASVEIKDNEGDIIKAEALEDALPQLLRRARFTKNHQDIIVGEILPMYKSSEGTIYKTEVRYPTDKDMEMFSYLDKSVPALFTVGNVYNDSLTSQKTRTEIQKNKLNCFSISGAKRKGDLGEVSLMDLDAVTLCEKGANPHATFKTIAKSDSNSNKVSECDNQNQREEVNKMPEEDAIAPEQPPATEETKETVVEEVVDTAQQIADLAEKIEEVATEVQEMKKSLVSKDDEVKKLSKQDDEDKKEDTKEEDKTDDKVEKKIDDIKKDVAEIKKSIRLTKVETPHLGHEVRKPLQKSDDVSIDDKVERIVKSRKSSGMLKFLQAYRKEVM